MTAAGSFVKIQHAALDMQAFRAQYARLRWAGVLKTHCSVIITQLFNMQWLQEPAIATFHEGNEFDPWLSCQS